MAKAEASTMKWLNPNDPSAEHDNVPSFTVKLPKEAVSGNYIEGKGSAGRGFYSLHTREAYKILLPLLQRNKQSFQRDLKIIEGNREFGCFICCMIDFGPIAEKKKEDAIRDCKLRIDCFHGKGNGVRQSSPGSRGALCGCFRSCGQVRRQSGQRLHVSRSTSA